MYSSRQERTLQVVQNYPGIIFFDEIDSLLPKRGNSTDSSNVSDRMIAQFLTEMDYCMTAGNIYIIGATNRPDLLDRAILQPGRFDVMIYLGINNDAPTRLSILKAKTKKMAVSADLEEVEKVMPMNFTGADIFSFVAKAYRNSLVRVKSSLEAKIEARLRPDQKSVRDWRKAVDEVEEEDKRVVVTLEDFKEALKTVKQSVSEKDLAMYQRFK